jgi:hypothetical protein
MGVTSSDPNEAARDPADLERQASEIRADMDRTLDALERKFSPEQLLDRSLGYLRDHGGELTQTLGATMRNNPVPIVLTLAGITWLVASSYNSRQPPGQDLSSRFARSGVGQRLQERASSARERVHSAADAARQRVASATDATKQRLSSGRTAAGGRLSGAVGSARENARYRAHEMQNRVYTMMEDQPLVIGALAVAVGAIIGTAIPSTQYENRVLGQARDRTLTKAQELGEQQYEKVRDTLQSQQGSSGTQSGQSGQSGLSSSESLSGRA